MNRFLSFSFISIILATQMLTCAYSKHSFTDMPHIYFKMFPIIQKMTVQDIKNELEKEIDPETHTFKKVAYNEGLEPDYVNAHRACHCMLENMIRNPEICRNIVFNSFAQPCLRFYQNYHNALEKTTLNKEEKEIHLTSIKIFIVSLQLSESMLALRVNS